MGAKFLFEIGLMNIHSRPKEALISIVLIIATQNSTLRGALLSFEVAVVIVS